jgi:hypothetical protein
MPCEVVRSIQFGRNRNGVGTFARVHIENRININRWRNRSDTRRHVEEITAGSMRKSEKYYGKCKKMKESVRKSHEEDED